MSGGTTVDIKYLTQPHDGTPGKPWDDFEERLLDVASGKTDERGWSLADCLNQIASTRAAQLAQQCPEVPPVEKQQHADANASRSPTR